MRESRESPSDRCPCDVVLALRGGPDKSGNNRRGRLPFMRGSLQKSQATCNQGGCI